MGAFTDRLSALQTDPSSRRWVFVPYDQVTDRVGPLASENPKDIGIVLVENPWKAARRPYHKQKLALILANLRHFAIEQAARGVAVRHVVASGPYRSALGEIIGETGPLTVMTPAERELREDLEPLRRDGSIEFVNHDGWFSSTDDFHRSLTKGKNPRMDAFYRNMRKTTGILMENNKPVGGKFSYDPENRQSWKGVPEAPQPPHFASDPIKDEAIDLINQHFSHHPGNLDPEAVPGTREDADKLRQWAKEQCLEHFGPYEDAMSIKSSGIFHTRLSALLNIQRILPADVVRDAEAMDIPLPSKEGFIRQIIGWREFMRHVHDLTDGFRELEDRQVPVRDVPGDAGYERWTGTSWQRMVTHRDPDGGAAPSALGADNPLPPAYWGASSGLSCLDRVVTCVWHEGYSHHITRLMVLGNIATLLDVNPRELTDWFWSAYTDAYDWVVEPNVLGMGTYALADFTITKPYVSGAAYINRMSDFCSECSFDPKKNCPITNLYWAFLARHEDALKDNVRMALPLKSLTKRSGNQRDRDERVFSRVNAVLASGDALKPREFPRDV